MHSAGFLFYKNKTFFLLTGSAYLPINSNWLQYLDSAETVFEDLKLESRQLLSLKADEACRMMADNSYKKDLWMWDQDWSIQTLKLKKQTKKKKKVPEDEKESETDSNFETRISATRERATNEKVKSDLKTFEILNKDYIRCFEDKNRDIEKHIKTVTELSKEFKHLFELGELLPVKRPYLAGYPAWYRKLCTKPGKEPDWTPGANHVTTSMQVSVASNKKGKKYL